MYWSENLTHSQAITSEMFQLLQTSLFLVSWLLQLVKLDGLIVGVKMSPALFVGFLRDR